MNTMNPARANPFASSSAYNDPTDWSQLSQPARTRPAGVPHALAFSGEGRAYFRIWIVNLLLTLVTFGLYYPWAKVRKLRWFYGHTSLAGHPFDFHGDPKRMLRGYLLVGALFALYAFAGQVSASAGVLALVIVAALWPALLCASMRFRLAQTSWRGLRFSFTGSASGAYLALAPIGGAVLLAVLFAAVGFPDPEADPPRRASFAAIGGFAVALLAAGALTPLTLCLLKRWQHGHYQFASVRTRFTAQPGAFYAISLKASLLMLALGLVSGLGYAVVEFMGVGRALTPTRLALLALVSLASYAAILFVVQPYTASRLQNLVWNHTQSRTIEFDSDLRFGPLARRTALNWVLVVLTLGLYWPYAAVALARLRLEAVNVVAHGDLDRLVARAGSPSNDASGDAAADLFGVDLGL